MAQTAYIHIPFCAHKCDFCDFTVVVGLEQRMSEYAEAVCHEIRQRLASPPSRPLKAVFYGGGTPGFLPPHLLARIHETLVALAPLAAGAEVTLETTPAAVSAGKAARWLETGVNRLSIGVESLDDRELAAMGRGQTRKQCLDAVETALEAGFTNVSCDLMYGLPEQTLESWTQTLSELVSLPIHHVSAYGLSLAGNSPLLSRYPRSAAGYPGEGDYERMYYRLVELCEDAGFHQYEISNFSRPGFESVHNLAYWDNEEYFGFGLSAHRYVDGVRSANLRSFNRYLRQPLENEFEERIDRETRLKEAIFLALRTRKGIDLGEFRRIYGADIRKSHAERLKRLLEGGFIALDGSSLRLTQKGVLVSNLVMAEFM